MFSITTFPAFACITQNIPHRLRIAIIISALIVFSHQWQVVAHTADRVAANILNTPEISFVFSLVSAVPLFRYKGIFYESSVPHTFLPSALGQLLTLLLLLLLLKVPMSCECPILPAFFPHPEL